MVDPVRSKIARSVRAKDTRPELYVRRALHRNGFRFRVHYKRLKGKPDIVLPKYRAIILVNGCFWHGHNCHIYRVPKQKEWRDKIERNKKRDAENIALYESLGWKVLVIWECAVQRKTKLPFSELMAITINWIQFDRQSAEIVGRQRKNNELTSI